MNQPDTRVSESSIGALSRCLVEGDPAQQRAAQKIRRRAISFSIVFQSLALAALFIFPLLGKGEHIPIKVFIERPPYRPIGHRPMGDTHNITKYTVRPCVVCNPFVHPQKPTRNGGISNDPNTPTIPGVGDHPSGLGEDLRFGSGQPREEPKPPINADKPPNQIQRIVVGHIDPARLTRRIDPLYPPICVQLHRETRVELQAVIATDGSIQYLQVISGDPLFYQSALNAVRQWQYTPTILNGRAVEVDTHITVIYSLNR